MGNTGPVLGALVIVVVLLAIPVMVLVSGAAAAALLGHVLRREGEATHPGSELIELYK